MCSLKCYDCMPKIALTSCPYAWCLVVAFFVLPLAQQCANAFEASGQFEDMSGDEFLKLMSGARNPIRDLKFDFTSSMLYVGSVSPPPLKDRHYTGSWTYSSELGHFLKYEVIRPADGKRVQLNVGTSGDHTTVLQTAISQEGQKGRRGQVESRSDNQFNGPAMPGRIFYINYFQSIEPALQATFRVAGWEHVDDRKCLKASFDTMTEPNSPRMTIWVDLERGAHLLEADVTDRKERLIQSLRNVELSRFGDSTWLPTYGEWHTYRYLTKANEHAFSATPVITEQIRLIHESIRINQGVTRNDLNVAIPVGTAVQDRASGKNYLQGPDRSNATTDPRLIEERLHERADDAGQHHAATLIQASSAARSSRLLSWSSFLLVLGAPGLIIACVVWKRAG